MGSSHNRAWRLLAGIFAGYELVSGLGSLGLGVYSQLLRQQYADVGRFASSPGQLLIALSSFTLVVALLGFLAIRTEKVALLRAFSLCAAVVLLFEVALGILAWIYREETMALTMGGFEPLIARYRTGDRPLDSAIDSLQQRLECCGMTSPEDWSINRRYNCTSSSVFCNLPDSCCMASDLQDRMNSSCLKVPNWRTIPENMTVSAFSNASEPAQMHSKGCDFVFVLWVKYNLDLVGIVILCMSLPQVIGVLIVHFYCQYVKERLTLYQSFSPDGTLLMSTLK